MDSVNGESSACKAPNVCSGDQDYMDSDNGMGPVPEEDVQVKHLREQVDFLQKQFCKANLELVEERSCVVGLTAHLKKAKEDINCLQDALKNQSLSFDKLKKISDLLKFYTGLDAEGIE